MSRSLRVVYMGTPAFAVSGLRSIVESQHEVVGIVTAPDRPAGRGKKLRFSAVKDAALEYNIALYQPEKLSSEETVAQLKALQADVFVVVAFRMLAILIRNLGQMILVLASLDLHKIQATIATPKACKEQALFSELRPLKYCKISKTSTKRITM